MMSQHRTSHGSSGYAWLRARLYTVIVCTMLVAFISGCGSSVNRASTDLGDTARGSLGASALAAHGIEFESAQEHSKRLVAASPTTFELPFPEATYAWERARIFFQRYTSSFSSSPMVGSVGQSSRQAPSLSISSQAHELAGRNQQSEVISSRVSTSDPYLFEVRKGPGKVGLAFSVSVRVRTPTGSSSEQANARLQAQNLARFIRTGELDTNITPAKIS